MKTNFGGKLLLVMIASVSILSACTNQSDRDGKTSSSPQALAENVSFHQSDRDGKTSSSPQALAENASSQMSQMPDSLFHWYSSTVEDCNNQVGMKISPDKLLLNYGGGDLGYADINAITHRDGGYDLKTTLYGMDESTNDFVVEVESLDIRFVPNPQNSEAEVSLLNPDKDGESPETETIINCSKVIKADQK